MGTQGAAKGGRSMNAKKSAPEGGRVATKKETAEIQHDLMCICSLSVRGLLSDAEKRKVLRRWEKRHELLLDKPTRRALGFNDR